MTSARSKTRPTGLVIEPSATLSVPVEAMVRLPAPVMVPSYQSAVPVTEMFPAPVSVPPSSSSVPEMVEPLPRLSVAPDCKPSVPPKVRLLAVWVPLESVTSLPELITTSSLGPGTVPLLQLLAVFQLPVAPPIQMSGEVLAVTTTSFPVPPW